MYSCTENQAVCRGCGKHLNGSPYYKGGVATDARGNRVKVNYYGGWVCSRSCDYRASLELEESMPGHGNLRSISPAAMRSLNHNFPESQQ